MTESNGKSKGLKVTDALNGLIAFANRLAAEEDVTGETLKEVFGLRERLVEPVCRFLEKKGLKKGAGHVMELYRAVEEYAVCFNVEPGRREERRTQMDVRKRLVRRSLLSERDHEGEEERLLDDIRRWQWKTTLDANGRIAFATGSGAAVPGRGSIIQEVGPQVIEQATKAQRPYSDDARPRDLRNEPGGMVNIRGAKRLIVVGDLHGRYDNLEAILGDKNNLKSVIDGEAHLVFMGDAVHPASSKLNTDKHYEDSFAVMLLIMSLKAENPFNVHYLLGNHDNAHAGGAPVGRAAVRQDATFESFIRRKVHASVLKRYREFVLNCPVAVRAFGAEGAILMVHATLSDRILNEAGYINIFMQGRRSKAIEELLWSRDFNPERIRKLAGRAGCRLVIGGHTVPTRDRAVKYGFEAIRPPAFGKAGDVQLILAAQNDLFGYVDVDLTRPVPESVTRLAAPDGRGACRALVAARASDAPGAEEALGDDETA
ncbi:MAG TPA: metallophosphoesterase family protein [Candidatus Brocadiia bacterium]|nr:metallophosphoesterase family protein [Candidatus Brocadiia bacterium]